MRTLILFFLLHITLLASSQNRCVTFDYAGAQQTLNPSTAKTINEAESFLRKNSLQHQTSTENIYTIPVVVHVLYNTGAQNISDAQIKSAIDALNRDYRRKNADSINTPQRFLAIAADIKIEFQLATADPKGKATNGITRNWTSRGTWLPDDKIKLPSQGGVTAWDTKSYLNIWIGNIAGAAGYATMPGSDADKDGVVINYAAFGIQSSSSFGLGRTAVHEVGHWLGLKHIWGDVSCGDDGIDDTPQQGWFTQGCPTTFRSSCNNGSLGDMYMNYMDYTNDACMNLFTKGQKERMRANFYDGGPRASLLKSKGLSEPWMNEAYVESSSTVSIYPNPATAEIHLQVKETFVGKQVGLFNSEGKLVKTLFLTSLLQTIDVSGLKPGVYFLKGNGIVEKFMKL